MLTTHSPSLHIAIDASRATGARRTGTENYARQTIERLVTVERGPDVRWTLFFQDEPGAWLAGHPHVERVVLPAPRLWTYTALAPALLRLRPDVFWEPAHVLPPSAPLARISSLVTVHDLGYEHFPQAHTAPQRLYLQASTRYHARAATCIAADSQATRRDLIALYGADPAKIQVVPLGVDHSAFRPVTDADQLAAVRQRYGTGERFLLYVGTLQPRKNLPRLVRAFARMAHEFPEVSLVLAGGQGWLADDLQAEVERMGLVGRVRRPGFVDAADLPALLSAAEAMVFPSLFEGFGLPVLEAMACGTPVLTSRTSSLPEVAGDAALLVDPSNEQQMADALRLLLSQPALRATLRERGLAQAQRFTWKRTADAIWEMLEETADDGRWTMDDDGEWHTPKPVLSPSPRARINSANGIQRRKARPGPEQSEGSEWNAKGLSSEIAEPPSALPSSIVHRPSSAVLHPSSLIPHPSTISLLGLPIHNLTWAETLERIEGMVERGEPHQLATVNPEFLMRARGDAEFMAVLRRANLVLPDGVGLLLAARLRGEQFQARVTGADLTPRLAQAAARRGWRLYLLGAAPGVADEAARRLRAQHPTLDVIADGSDPAPDGPPELLARIREAAPQVLLVAYGAAKQDLWIDRFGKSTGVPVQIGIGGSLDFIAGVVPRAPQGWQRLGVEWLWRLKEEPWRWRRMLALPRFLWATTVETLAKK